MFDDLIVCVIVYCSRSPAGQLRNLSSFGQSNSANDASCPLVYGYIVDRTSRKNVSICGPPHPPSGQQPDESTTAQIYVSRSNQLQIVIKADVEQKFIIRLEGQSFFVFSNYSFYVLGSVI
jgi:hypothetical protein